MNTLARHLRLGRLAYRVYHRPRAAVAAAHRRGFANSLGDAYHHRAMRGAAAKLPQLPAAAGTSPIRVHFLTGRRFWHQTAFCAWSLSKVAGVEVVPVLHDDGTLAPHDVDRIRRVFPKTEVATAEAAEARLDSHLPRSRFPCLRSRRDVYPNLKKLTDVHAGQHGWKLVLDSDMLFFRRPDTLLDWLAAPDRPCHMVDCETSYGYPLDFLSQQCGAVVREKVNVGVTGLRSESIDWDRLETWMAGQIEKFGPHYFQEQAVIAQLTAADPCLVLDEVAYRVLPDDAEGRWPKAVMHHYVAGSKPLYYRYGWRAALAAAVARREAAHG